MGPNLSSTLEPEMAGGPSRVPLSSRYIRFGPFQVDQQREEVSKNGTRLKLQGKVYQVLVALIEKQGEVVTRDELRLRLWPADTHVNYDANVNTTVNKLRQALGDSSEKPLYIETIPRKGYCLIVRSEFTDIPQTVTPTASTNGANGKVHAEITSASRSDIWVTLGIIGLILGGMLLGAAITKLWIYHFAPTPGSLWF
jgi:DNA-binding winged helix-turn-helix (wHTH) protein